MSDLTKKTSGTAISGTATENFFLRYGRGAANRTFIGDLLRFHKFGEYRAGQYDDEIALGTRMTAYMNSLCVGWQCWEGNRPTDQVMGPIAEGFIPPPRGDLDRLDKSKWEKFDDGREKDPWAFTNTLVLVDLKGNEPRFFTFTTSSKGGLGALGTLSFQYGQHLRQKPSESPIIELGRDDYVHPKGYGEIRVPVFTIVGWVPTKDLPPIEGPGGEPLQLPDESRPTANF
jgi:hypothetical protein